MNTPMYWFTVPIFVMYVAYLTMKCVEYSRLRPLSARAQKIIESVGSVAIFASFAYLFVSGVANQRDTIFNREFASYVALIGSFICFFPLVVIGRKVVKLRQQRDAGRSQ